MLFPNKVSIIYWWFHFCMEDICVLQFSSISLALILLSIFFHNSLFFLKCPSLPHSPEINLLRVRDTEAFNELVAVHTYYFSSCLVGVKSNIVNMSPNIVKA